MSLRFLSQGMRKGDLHIAAHDEAGNEVQIVTIPVGEIVRGLAKYAKYAGRGYTDDDATRDAAAAWAMDQLRDLEASSLPDKLDASGVLEDFAKSKQGRFLNADAGQPLV